MIDQILTDVRYDTSMRSCEQCAGPIINPAHAKVRFCSRKCRVKACNSRLDRDALNAARRADYAVTEKVDRAARREEVRREFPDCLYCGKSMEGRAPHARCCSKLCSTKLWYYANHESALAAMGEYRKDNAEYFRDASAIRRARLAGVAVYRFTPADWLRLQRRFNGCCAYCGSRPVRLTKDHVIPIVRGGSHGAGNILPACLSCNQSKHDKTLTEWGRCRRA